MLADAKSEVVFQAVAENPGGDLPFPLQFAEVLSPLLAECWQDPNTGAWNIIPTTVKNTHVRYTQSGSTSFSHWTGYEDYDQDDEEWSDP